MLIALLIAFQWNNFRALTFFLFQSEEKIAEMGVQNAQAITKAMSKVPGITLRELTKDELEMLSAGEIAPEDAVILILDENETAETPLSSVPDIVDYQARLAEALAEVYVLKATFSNSLESLKDSAIAEYKELTDEERTRSAKLNLGFKYIGLAGDLESECDARMDVLLFTIEDALRATGGDLSLISDIRSIYNNEKSIRKAEYLSLYNSL